MITTDAVKKLRDATGVSVMQCKSALEEADGDFDKALEILKQKGNAIAAKKSDRTLGAGAVSAYIHANKEIGSMVVLRSETDFVSKNEEFLALGKELALQVAAMDAENVPALLAQPYIKDPEKKVADLITAAIQKFGERIEIEKFSRFSTK
jgi:elongation factor Ts